MKYTRDDPATHDPNRRDGRIVPDCYWWEARPDVVEVSWVAPIVCTGAGRHKSAALGDVARLVLDHGRPTLELADARGDWAAIHGPQSDRQPGEGSRSAWRFLCPRCGLDRRVSEATLLRLATLAAAPAAHIDVSRVLT